MAEAIAGGEESPWRRPGGEASGPEPVLAEDAFLRAAMRSPIAMCVVDRDGRFLVVNEAMCRFTGRPESELLAMRWQAIVDPEVLAAETALVGGLTPGVEHVRVAKRYRAADGSVRFGDLSVSPIRDRDGVVRRFLGQIVDVTGRVHTEERYHLLTELGSDVVARVGRDGLAEWVSPSVELLLGWRPEELVGRHLRELLAEPDQARVHAEAAPLEHGEPVRFDARMRHRDGSTRWLSVMARPILGDDGTVVGRVDGWRDIDEQVRARDAVMRSEARFRLLAENASDVVYLSGADGRIQWVSPSASTVLGRDPADLVGRQAIEFVFPEDLPRAQREQERMLRGETVIFEVRMRRVDGGVGWYQALIQPVVDQSGAVVGRTGSIRDITAEHDAREALEASERLHRSAMEALHEGVVVHDRSGRIVAVSPAALRVLGGTAEDAIGRTVDELGWHAVGDDGRPVPAERHPAVATLRDGVPLHEAVMRLVHVDGRSIWLRVNTAPLRDGDGQLVGMVGSFTDITDQRAADAALRASEERFRAALESLDEGVVVLRAGDASATDELEDLRVDWANRRAMDEWFQGWSQEDVQGRRFLEVKPDAGPELLATYRSVLAGDGPHRELVAFPVADERRMLDARVVPFPGGLLHIASDVTEMQRLTEEMRAGERRFRIAFEALDVGVSVLRPVLGADGRLVDAEIVWANRTTRTEWFWGRPLSELEGRRVFELDPDVRDFLTPVYREVLETQRIHRAEVEFPPRAGRQAVWIEHRIVPFEDGILHMGTDVTATHQARRSLEEAHQIARLGVWRRDLRTGEATWSDQMYRIFERDPRDGPLDPEAASAMGRVPIDRMRAAAEARAATSRNEEWEAERELVRSDGRPLWILTRTRAERDAAGDIVAYRGTTQDITERRLAQQIQERFSVELEQRVADRTEDLATANEELRSFSYSLSHDLRAPLRSIAGFAGMLQRNNREQLDEEGQRRLANIITASQTMGAVIDDLLLYLRLGNGALVLRPIALDAEVDSLRVAHAALLSACGGRLELDAPVAVPLADPTLLREILGNLVENALHYRRPDVPPVVRISAVAADGAVTIAVADNGIGIETAAQGRIFEAFVRLAGDEAHPGTGIGLAVVWRAARAMDTDVTVESEVGVGSTFRVVLPEAPTGR